MRRLRAALDVTSAVGAVIVGLNATRTIDVHGWRVTAAVIIIGVAAALRVGLDAITRAREERNAQFSKAVSEALRSAWSRSSSRPTSTGPRWA